MKSSNYIFRSFSYYFRQHLSVLLGTILSTAIITGALIVGDSVKFSLLKLTDKRLGSTEFAMHGKDRFFSDSLAIKLSQFDELTSASLLQLSAIAIEPENDKRIHEINVYGVDSIFGKFTFDEIGRIDQGCYLSQNAAERLNISEGQELLLRVRNIDLVPVNTPFVQEKASSVSLRIKVDRIISDDEYARFSLQTDQKAPYNVFVSRQMLQEKMKLVGKSNVLLAKSNEKELAEEEVQALLAKAFSTEDAGLRIKTSKGQDWVEINSDRVFIDQVIVEEMNAYSDNRILTYLVNSIYMDNSIQTPYSFVSALPQKMLPYDLKADEIILNDWCARDLNLMPGDSLTLKYFVIGAYRSLDTVEKRFIVKGIEENQGALFKRDLMPDFPGLSDAKSCSEWDTGIPIDLEKIRDKDEEYWNEFKGTPKAIIKYSTGAQLWSNAFGSATALRFSLAKQQNWKDAFSSKLLPEYLGFKFSDVKKAGQLAASNSVDFAELFLSLSFFVIAAAVLLIILLFSLNIQKRKGELLRMKALGISRKKIFNLYFLEVLIPVFLGSVIGAFAGILYNNLILSALNSLWYDAVRTHALDMHITFGTLFIGFISGLLISVLTVYFLLRSFMKDKKLIEYDRKEFEGKGGKIYRVLFYLLLFLSIADIVWLANWSNFQDQSSYMMAGALLLILLIFAFWYLLQNWKRNNTTIPSIQFMVKKYLSTNSKRNILALSLLSLGIFAVIITAANRKTFSGEITNPTGPAGGYEYWMETAFPLIYDPNSAKGQQIYGFEDDERKDKLEFLPLLTIEGDDASCLNLNQVQNPRILALDPEVLQGRGSFSFTQSLTDTKWEGLENEYEEGVIPAFIDQTVITWGLMKKLGDTLIYHDENGDRLDVIIAGALANTIFQGNILISEKNMRKYFPSVGGAKVCLVDVNDDSMEQTNEFLEFYFRDYGMDYQLNSDRLIAFNSVTNTYLNVFMMLGALGVLIGTIGLGIILLRSRHERKRDNALMLSLGINKKNIRKIFLIEHLIILFGALIASVLAGVIAVIPSIATQAYEMPFAFIIAVLGLIAISGVIWIALFSYTGLTKNVLRELRSE